MAGVRSEADDVVNLKRLTYFVVEEVPVRMWRGKDLNFGDE